MKWFIGILVGVNVLLYSWVLVGKPSLDTMLDFVESLFEPELVEELVELEETEQIPEPEVDSEQQATSIEDGQIVEEAMSLESASLTEQEEMTLAVDTSTGDLLEMTPRVARIQQRIMETMLSQIAPWGDGLTIFDGDEAANEALRARPMIVREAMAFRKLLSEMPIRVQPDEFFVGSLVQTQANRGKPFPDYATYEEKRHANRKGIAVFPSWGHYPPNYRRTLQFGLSGLEAQARQALATLSVATDPEGRKRNFYEAILVAFDGVRHYVRRHQEAAREQLADEPDPQRREELERIITTLDRVPEYPAETFYEACQSFWITFATLQNMGNSTPVGRWDQFMYPYFERDMSAGRLTLDAAQEMVDCLWMKFNERARFLPLVYRDAEQFQGLWSPNSSKEYYKPSVAFIHFGDNAVERDTSNPAQFVHWLQNIIVGGQTRDGRDGTNDLTYMALAASRKSPFSQPIVSVRFWSGSPRELFEDPYRIGHAADVQRRGHCPSLCKGRVPHRGCPRLHQ